MRARHQPATTLSPVQRYLHLCGRVFLATAHHEELVSAAQKLAPDEWHLLFAEATAQGMAPIVYHLSAISGALAAAPQAIAAIFAASYTRALVSVRRLELQLEEILRAFAAHERDILVLKGPPLVRRLYSDPALRPIGDLDLLARYGDVPRAIDTLTSLGYHALPGYGDPHDFHALRGWTVIYRRADEPLIELHWRPVSLASYEPAFSPDDLWPRSIRARVGNEPARLLDPEDELRYLCVHYAAEHRGKRLLWLVDIARLLQTVPDNWEWERFTTTAIALGAATPVLASLDDCQAILGLEAPHAPVAALRAAATSPSEQHAWALAQTTFYQPRRLLAHARALETPHERLILARGAFTWYAVEGRTWALRRFTLARRRIASRWP